MKKKHKNGVIRQENAIEVEHLRQPLGRGESGIREVEGSTPPPEQYQ